MKKTLLAVLIFLLLMAATFVNILKVGVATTGDLWATPALPEGISREPMPENYTVEDYLNTTNPYVVGEVDDPEGNRPLYVLVFGDEEEREKGDFGLQWDWYAKFQLERGDNALAANFGIDIRILDFLEWDSDDSKDTMEDLWYELESDTKQYLRTWYDGEWWSNYVDAVIGITAQETTDNTAGKSPSDDYLDAGRIFILLKWQAYWADDNLVQHEVSHLYYAPDHPEPQPPAPCCAMAYHTHFQTWIWEGTRLWWVFSDVPCLYTAYSWCTNCHQTIQQNSCRYGDGGGGGCPTLFVWNGTGYVDYGVINIHNPTGEDVIREVPIQSEDVCINSHKAKFRFREGWEGLNFSESVIDQVKLYAVDSQGNRHLCPLISAEHSRLGNVLPQLLLSDDYRAQMLLLETVDLTFVVPWYNIQGFTFIIEGCNMYKLWD